MSSLPQPPSLESPMMALPCRLGLEIDRCCYTTGLVHSNGEYMNQKKKPEAIQRQKDAIL